MSKCHALSKVLPVLIMLSSSAAALADSNESVTPPINNVNTPASASINSSSTSQPASAKSSSWPKRTAGMLIGIVVGIPICAVRQPIHEEKYGVYQTAGKKARPRKTIPYAVIYAPFALVSGLIEAPFYALNNSIVNCDKPFSKQQFSITDREEPLNVDPIKGTSSR